MLSIVPLSPHVDQRNKKADSKIGDDHFIFLIKCYRTRGSGIELHSNTGQTAKIQQYIDQLGC